MSKATDEAARGITSKIFNELIRLAGFCDVLQMLELEALQRGEAIYTKPMRPSQPGTTLTRVRQDIALGWFTVTTKLRTARSIADELGE